MNKIITLTVFLLSFLVTPSHAQQFITVRDGNFVKNEKPYHYIGTNYWYGALAAAKNGDRKRVRKELDELKSKGITNLRILVGAESGQQDFTVTPALQPQQGAYNETLLDGLDYLLAEMGKRDMDAVLYLNNNWEWSGGMAQYLEWNGYGKLPNPNVAPNTWPQFMAYTRQFYSCAPCKLAFENHIRFILGRTNAYTHKKYTDDPAIMAWQLANEPRIFTPENEAAFTGWLNATVNLIDSLDPNHLISTGSEGKAGSNDDLQTFQRTHNNPKIDYLTMHIWPKNWGWYQVNDEAGSTPVAIAKTIEYIDSHITVAKALNKPIVLEEFGYPRAQESLSKKAELTYRNQFYKAIFQRLVASIEAHESFTALNFWGYGGYGKNDPKDGKWKNGDDFTADPPQEPQGLNSVFSTDTTTLELIKEYNTKIRK